MLRFSRKNEYIFLLILLFSCIYTFTLNLVFRSTFLINDNTAILLNSREGFIVRYVGVLFSYAIAFFHQNVSSEINWYSIFLIACHIVAFSLAIDGFCRTLKRFFLLSSLIFYGVAYGIFMIAVDYTAASIMLGANAIFHCIVSYDYESLSGNWGKNKLILFRTAFLLCIATLVRLRGLFAVLAFTAPVLITFLFILAIKKYSFNFSRFFQGILAITLIIGPALGTYYLDNAYKQYYAPIDYRLYDEFDRVRGKIHGFDLVQPSLKAIELNQWTENDALRLSSWLFFDEEKYNTKTMQVVVDNSSKSEKINFQYVGKRIKELISEYFPFWIAISSPLIGTLILKPSKEKRFLVFVNLILTLFFFMLGLYFSVFLRFPFRVGFPSLLVAFTTNVLVYKYIEKRIEIFRDSRQKVRVNFTLKTYKVQKLRPVRKVGVTRRTSTLIIVLMIFLAAYCNWKYLSNVYQFRLAQADRFEYIFSTLSVKYENSIILPQPGPALQFEFINPFSSAKPPFTLINSGWNTFSPRFYKQIQTLGIEKGTELPLALADHPNAYVLATKDWIDLLCDYVYEENKHLLEAQVVEQFNEINLVKLKRKNSS